MPTIAFPTFDFSELLAILLQAINAVIMPALPFLIGAAAVTGAVAWISHKGKSVVKVK